METIKEIGKRVKVVLTQILALVLSFFFKERKQEKLSLNEKKESAKIVKKEEKIVNNGEITPLPDEEDIKSENHTTYEQSITTINSEEKEIIKNRLQAKEIYFSEIVIINTIVEVLEEKNGFHFAELPEIKKEKVKKEVEKINDRLTPSIKKEMQDNKITTKEELKDKISKKVNVLHYNNNPIKEILNEKNEVLEQDSNQTEELEKSSETSIEPETHEEKPRIITIAPREKEIPNKEKEDFITIKKEEPSKDANIYYIADIINDERKHLNLPDIVETNAERNLISEVTKDTAIAIETKSKKIPFLMVAANKKGKPPAKERIKNAVIDTALVAASIAAKQEKAKEKQEKEILDEKPEPPKPFYIAEEDTTTEEEKRIADIAVDREILEEIKEDLKKQQLLSQTGELSFNYSTPEKEPEPIVIPKIDEEINKKTDEEIEIEKETITITEPEPKEKNEPVQEPEDLIEETIPKETSQPSKDIELPISAKEEKQSEKIEEKTPISITAITTSQKNNKEIKEIYKNTETTIIDANNEIRKEELEDKDYDFYEKQIDDLLYAIEMYKIKNYDSITPSEREKLNQEKNKLKSLKNKLETQKEIDIEKEKKELEAEITENEIENIQRELEKMHIEHLEETGEKLIEELSQMEARNDAKLAEIEQQLIKSKLKKAARIAEIPSIIALPFIRNKYFFYFTIGLFINNHFNFLNNIFKRKVVKFEPIDLTEIKNGYDALDKALDQTYENLVYLDYLENESITKYPNLKYDKEFNKYIIKIRNKLNSNYNKLQQKQKMINKYIKQNIKTNKVLKKYRLVKENNAA